MAIKRQPHSTLWRIMDGSTELMRFRKNQTATAKAEARKQTSLLRRDNPERRYSLEFYSAGTWHLQGEVI